MGETDQPAWMRPHRELYEKVPEAPGRIGYAELQRALGWGQRGRVKRTVSTLVGLDVLTWQGLRSGRAVSQGPRTLDEALADGLQPMPDREIATYPLLTGPVDDFITSWHESRQDPIDNRSDNGGSDGVTVYPTWRLPGGSGAYTRPDLTAVVDLQYPSLGPWNEVHAIEVKPYWSVSRTALFEAVAQAALQRCTHSWLVVWIPNPDSGHFRPDQRAQIHDALKQLGDPGDSKGSLRREAQDFGIGLATVEELSEEASVRGLVDPVRRVMDPAAADELFKVLKRTDAQL